MRAVARDCAVTLNTVIQVAWGIVLGRLSGRDDVVFGVTVAGRPVEIAGVERMVGLFINTLPLRMSLPPGKPFAELLRETQDSQSRLAAHPYLGLSEIQQAAGVGDLFDTLMVFENYPAASVAPAQDLKLVGVHGRDATHYPLTLVVQPDHTLGLRLDYRPDLFERGSIEALGARLLRLLQSAAAGPERAIGSLEWCRRTSARRCCGWGWGLRRRRCLAMRRCRRCSPRRFRRRRRRKPWSAMGAH